MAAYNTGKYIGDAIESILNQSLSSFELIIVNDGSKDETEFVINRYLKDKRVKYYKNPENKGLVYTRNRLLGLARGEYVAIMDSDDIAHPERLAKQHRYILNNPYVGLLGTWVQPIDKHGNHYGPAWCSYDNPEGVYCSLLFQNFFANSSVFMKKSLIPEDGYREGYPPAEDYDLWSRILIYTKGYNFPEILVYYRLHNTNTSIVNETVTKSNAQKIILNQLKQLNITPDEESLQLHLAISEFGYNQIKEECLPEIKAWLEYLYKMNLATGKYDNDAFLRILGKYWFRVCQTRRKNSLLPYLKARLLRSQYNPGYRNYFSFFVGQVKRGLEW